MAEKTSVTKAYGSARLAREKAEKILNGTAGRGGLESAWLRIQGRYADRNKPGYFTKQITEEYNRIKIAYEKTAKEYQDALALETKYKEELDAVAKKENKTKIVQDAADKLAKAKAEKAKADSVVPSRGQEQATAAATAVTDAQAAYDEAKGQSSTSTSNKPTTPQEDYAGYTLDPSTGAVYGPGVEGQNGLQGLFVPMPDSKGNVVNQFVTSSNRAVEGFLKQYQGPGQLEQLKKKLLDSGYIKQSQFSGTAWLSGLVDMFKNYSSDYLYKIKFENATDVPGIDVFMTQKKPGSGTGGIPVRVITTRGEAKTLLDGYMSDLIGRPSTAEEESVFYEQLHKAENKATRTTVGGTITGSVLTEADRLMIAAKVARKTLRGSNVDELLKSNIGSTVALDIASMQKYAAKYGIDMTPAEALKRVADGIGQENYAAKQQERLRQLSMTLHPYLKEHIAAGGTVQDVADAYAYTKSTKLGVAIPTSTKDKDIMKAIASGKTIADFDRELQADPLWRRTDEARKLSSDFTSTMLKTFGLG